MELDLDGPEAVRRRQQVLSPLSLRAYMAGKLPLALFAGLRVDVLDAQTCAVSVPYGWRSTNPFRSIYFAAQAMAAELSSGALGLIATQSAPEPVSMLIVGLEAQFIKKAASRSTFRCDGGDAIAAAIRETLATGAGTTARVQSVGTDANGDVVSQWTFEWSFKRKRPAA